MALRTGLLGRPSGVKPWASRMSSGISMRRKASICHWGEPYQTESVPQGTRSLPMPRISVPSRAAQWRGCTTAEEAKVVPSSA